MRQIKKPMPCDSILVSLPHPRDPKACIARPAVVVQSFGSDLVNAKVFLDDLNDIDVPGRTEAFTLCVTSIPFDGDGVRFDDKGDHVTSWRYAPRCDDLIEVPGEDPEPVDLSARATEIAKLDSEIVRVRAEVKALRDYLQALDAGTT